MNHRRFAPLLTTVVAGLVLSALAAAQSGTIDVTLEVLDDVSGIDAVVMQVREIREPDSNRDSRRNEAPAGDALDRAAGDGRESPEREAVTDRDERPEPPNETDDPGV